MKFKDSIITTVSFLKQPKKRKLIQLARSLSSKEGIEIGGPSTFFSLRGGFPVYLFAKKIDGVNFSTETVWEGQIKEGDNYNYYDDKKSFQYIAEATNLSNIPDNKYDFVLSCHSLEHVANPIKALKEWNRIVKKRAMLVLILPDKRYTFDINRPYTSFQHLLNDYENNVDEYDTTHFEEIAMYHDKAKDPCLTRDLKDILINNYENRTAHHHVFSHQVIKQMLEFCGFNVSYQQEMDPFHLINIAYSA